MLVRRRHGDHLAARALRRGAALHGRAGGRRHRRRAAGHGRRPSRCCPAMLGFAGRAIDRLHVPGPARVRRRPVRPRLLVPVEPDRPAPALDLRRRRRCWSWWCWPSRCSRCAWPSPTPATTRPSLTTRQAYDLLAAGVRARVQRSAGHRRRRARRHRARRTGRPSTGWTPAGAARRAWPRSPGRMFNAGRRRRGHHRLPDDLAPGGRDRPRWSATCAATVIPPVVARQRA